MGVKSLVTGSPYERELHMTHSSEVPVSESATQSAPKSHSSTSARPASASISSIGEIFTHISTHIVALIRGEIELAQAKVTTMAQKMGLGIALLGAAGLFALYMLGWIFHTIELAFALILPAWASSLIVTALLLVIVIVLAVVGKAQLGKAKTSVPNPQVGVNASIDAVKKGMRNG